MAAWHPVLTAYEWFVIGYFALINTMTLILIGCAVWEMRQHVRRIRIEELWRILRSEVAPSLSVLAPAYNEAATVGESVRALLTLSYPGLEVVVINDGSRDETIDILRQEFALFPVHPVFRRRVETSEVRALFRSAEHPGLVVVDKDNGGKADALNTGLNVASGRLVCAIDADTLIEPDALLRMVRPFLSRNDILATGGTIRVANGCVVRAGRVAEAHPPHRLLPGVQAVEYLRAFLFGRLGWNRLGGNLIISGAFGLFTREAMLRCGGYQHDTVGEDMEIVARLRRAAQQDGTPHRVEFVPDPVAWTEVPTSLRVLGRQRDRWHRGLADVLWRHRDAIARPRYRALGMIALPYFVIELVGPVIELLGLAGLLLGLATGALSPAFGALFFVVGYGYALVLNCLTLAMEQLAGRRYSTLRDQLWLFLWAAVETFGYRQLTLVWRLRGLVKYMRGNKEWGVMTRAGFATSGEPPAARPPA